MPCNCGNSHCPECMGGWTPPPSPIEGDNRWKDSMAFDYCCTKRLLNETAIIKLPTCKGHELGYMAVRRSSAGCDYFRVDSIINHILTGL